MVKRTLGCTLFGGALLLGLAACGNESPDEVAQAAAQGSSGSPAAQVVDYADCSTFRTPQTAADEQKRRWLTSERAKVSRDAIEEAIERRFGANGKEDSTARLRAGYFGAFADDDTQELVHVVDPSRVDIAELDEQLSTAGAAQHQKDAKYPVIAIRVEPSCVSADKMEQTYALLRDATWHPDAKKALVSYAVVAKQSAWVVNLRDYPEARQKLEQLAGDSVVVDE